MNTTTNQSAAYATNLLGAPRSTFERIDPDTAKTWLDEHNQRNRPVSKAHVRLLAADLAAGRWRTTHQGIAFDRDGQLVDGQHRLWAIVESGVSAVLQVTRGVDPMAFEVIDQHRKRTAGQILAMEGIQRDAPRFAAMARALLVSRFGHSRPTVIEGTQFALEHQDHFGKYLPIARKFGPAAGAAFALASMWGWTTAEESARRLMDLDFDGEADPMKVFYKATESQFPRLGAGDSGMKERFAITMNCLTAAEEHRGMKVVRKSAPDFKRLETLRPAPGPVADNDTIPRPPRVPADLPPVLQE